MDEEVSDKYIMQYSSAIKKNNSKNIGKWN